MPSISIILPFFNAEKTLSEAIQSILNQTFTDFELILVNNNSTDKSLEIAQSFQDNRIKIIQEPKQGVMHAFNRGLQVAKGKYIARTDADDICLPNRFALQKKFLDKNSTIGVVSGLVKYEGHRADTQGFQMYVDWVNSIQTPQQIQNELFVESPIVNPTMMTRRELFEKYGTYQDGNFPEDYELWLRWSEQGVNFQKITEEILIWRDSDTRLTRTDERYSTDAFYRIKTKYLVKKLQKVNPHFPKVWIWGAGKRSRKRAHLLTEYGIQIVGSIDVVRNKIQDYPCIYFEDIPEYNELFILSYVANRGVGVKIREFLLKRGFTEGKNFILVA